MKTLLLCLLIPSSTLFGQCTQTVSSSDTSRVKIQLISNGSKIEKRFTPKQPIITDDKRKSSKL
ncbi:MAG: hypothetical protein LW688_09385 [Cryomorphaceae bacterium]|nr:hypothetical protein [Cryomorphaceae bacterium]